MRVIRKLSSVFLAFVKERTLPALKEALLEGRTVVWYKDQLIGRRQWLEPLFAGCVQVDRPHHRTDKMIYVRVRNTSEADIRLERTGALGPPQLDLPAGTTSLVQVAVSGPAGPVELGYTAKNFLIEPEKGLPVVLKIPGP